MLHPGTGTSSSSSQRPRSHKPQCSTRCAPRGCQHRGDGGDRAGPVAAPVPRATRAPAPAARPRCQMRSSPCRHPGAAPTATAPQPTAPGEAHMPRRKPHWQQPGQTRPQDLERLSLSKRDSARTEMLHPQRTTWGSSASSGEKRAISRHQESNRPAWSTRVFLCSHANKEERLG